MNQHESAFRSVLRKRGVRVALGSIGVAGVVGVGVARFGPDWVEDRMVSALDDRGIAVDFENLDISRRELVASEICFRPEQGPEVELCADSAHVRFDTRGVIPRQATVTSIELGTLSASTSRRVADLPELFEELRTWRPDEIESHFDVRLADDVVVTIEGIQVYADDTEAALTTISSIELEDGGHSIRFDADIHRDDLISGPTWSARPVGPLSVSARRLEDDWQIIASAPGGLIARETTTLPCLQARIAEIRWAGREISLTNVGIENSELGRNVASLPRVAIDLGEGADDPISIDVDDLIVRVLTEDPQLEGIACTRAAPTQTAGQTPLQLPSRPIEIEMSEMGLAFADALGVPYTEFMGSARVRVDNGVVTLNGELRPPDGWELLGPLDLMLVRDADGALSARIESRSVPITDLLGGIAPDEINALIDGSALATLTADTTEHGDVEVAWTLSTSPITVQVPRMRPQTIPAQSWSIRAGPSAPGARDLVLTTGRRTLLGLEFEASLTLDPFDPAEMNIAEYALARFELPEQSLAVLGDGVLDRAFGMLADAPIGQRFSALVEVPVRWSEGRVRISPPQLARMETEALLLEYTPESLTLSSLGCIADATLQARLLDDPSLLVTLSEGTAPSDNWRCRATDAARFTLRTQGNQLADSLRGQDASLGELLIAAAVEEVVRAEANLDEFEIGVEIHNLDALSSIEHVRDVPRAINEVVDVWGRLNR